MDVIRSGQERSGASKKNTVKWEGISSFNNFSFIPYGVTACRAYKVGNGRLFQHSAFKGTCGFNFLATNLNYSAFKSNDKPLISELSAFLPTFALLFVR